MLIRQDDPIQSQDDKLIRFKDEGMCKSQMGVTSRDLHGILSLRPVKTNQGQHDLDSICLVKNN